MICPMCALFSTLRQYIKTVHSRGGSRAIRAGDLTLVAQLDVPPAYRSLDTRHNVKVLVLEAEV